jgi:endo-1,4-beta-xylanase
LLVGVSVAPAWLKETTYADLLLRVFNVITPENAMKWEVIHPDPERYDFSQGDAIVDFARQHGLKVRGHTLAWVHQNPDWLVNGDYTREQWIEILRDHIQTVVGHYKDYGGSTVYAWDVVNEAIQGDGAMVNSIWLEKIGPEYIPLAFQVAHEADPEALLFYNDNGGEGLDVHSQAIYDLVKSLKESGVPIDGVGMQMHVAMGEQPAAQDLATNMQRLADLGLIVHITEMDVRTQYSTA